MATSEAIFEISVGFHLHGSARFDGLIFKYEHGTAFC
jgi:hypothetical protein